VIRKLFVCDTIYMFLTLLEAWDQM
jgi:hypothetical protein